MESLESFLKLQKDVKASQDPNSMEKLPEINYNIGKIKYDFGNYENSMSYFLQVIEDENAEEDQLYWAHYMLGNVYMKFNNIEKALEHYELASDTEDVDLTIRINKSVQEIEVSSNY